MQPCSGGTARGRPLATLERALLESRAIIAGELGCAPAVLELLAVGSHQARLAVGGLGRANLSSRRLSDSDSRETGRPDHSAREADRHLSFCGCPPGAGRKSAVAFAGHPTGAPWCRDVGGQATASKLRIHSAEPHRGAEVGCTGAPIVIYSLGSKHITVFARRGRCDPCNFVP